VVKIEVTNLNNYMNKTAKTSELGRPDKCWRIWQIKKKNYTLQAKGSYNETPTGVPS
jgi:hypothetical protein